MPVVAGVQRIGSIRLAAVVVASIPATVLLLVAQRYIAAGVTAGAVKE